MSQQAGGSEQPPHQDVLAAPRGSGSWGFTTLLVILAFSAGGYFGNQLKNGGEPSQQREAGVTEVTSGVTEVTSAAPVATASGAHGRNCNNAPVILASHKVTPDTEWPRHFDPLYEGAKLPAGKCLWVDWDSSDAEGVQIQTAVGWVDINVAEGWYMDNLLKCPAPGKTDIDPPA